MTLDVHPHAHLKLSEANSSLPQLQGLGFDRTKLEAGVRLVKIAEMGFEPTSARPLTRDQLREVLQMYMDTAWKREQDNPFLTLLEISNVSGLEISSPIAGVRLAHEGDMLLRWVGGTGGIGIESLSRDGHDRFSFYRTKKESALIEIPDGDRQITFFSVHTTPASKPELYEARGRLSLSFSGPVITQYDPINELRRHRDSSSDPFYSAESDKHLGTIWKTIWREAGIPDATTDRKGEFRDFGTGITFSYRDGHSYKELIANFDQAIPGELLSRMVHGLRHVNPQWLDGKWIGESGGHEAGCYLEIRKSGKEFCVHTDGAESMLRLIIQIRTVAALGRTNL
jgi:hypothetical protein